MLQFMSVYCIVYEYISSSTVSACVCGNRSVCYWVNVKSKWLWNVTNMTNELHKKVQKLAFEHTRKKWKAKTLAEKPTYPKLQCHFQIVVWELGYFWFSNAVLLCCLYVDKDFGQSTLFCSLCVVFYLSFQVTFMFMFINSLMNAVFHDLRETWMFVVSLRFIIIIHIEHYLVNTNDTFSGLIECHHMMD